MGGVGRNAVLIGHSGFLGAALTTSVGAMSGGSAQLIVDSHHHFVRDVLDGNGRELVAPLLARDGQQDWICAVGIVDPAADSGLIEAINVEFPLRLYRLLDNHAQAGKVRLVTFGSILEKHQALTKSNPYLASKSRMVDALCKADSAVGWHHFRLHTLYGGRKRPHPFMFAGQMFDALARRDCFKMSDGTQLREYHHVEDIAGSVLAFLAATHDDRLIEMSSGNPVRLRDFAAAIFEHFYASHLLEVGARDHSTAEVFVNPYQRSPYLIASREPVAGVIAWFETLRSAGFR